MELELEIVGSWLSVPLLDEGTMYPCQPFWLLL